MSVCEPGAGGDAKWPVGKEKPVKSKSPKKTIAQRKIDEATTMPPPQKKPRRRKKTKQEQSPTSTKVKKVAPEIDYGPIFEELEQANDISKIKRCLRKLENPYATDKQGRTVLHHLVKKEHAIVKRAIQGFLSRSDIDPSRLLLCPDSDGNLPVHTLFQENFQSSDAIIRTMLEKVPEDKKVEMLKKRNGEGDTCFHLIAKFEGLSDYRLEQILEAFAAREGENVSIETFCTPNFEGETPIHLAIKHDNMAVIAHLFQPFPLAEKKVDIQGGFLGPNSKNGQTAAHTIVQMFDPRQGHQLQGDQSSRLGRMLFFIACQNPQMIEHKDNNGKTAYDLAQDIIRDGAKIPEEIQCYLANPKTAASEFESMTGFHRFRRKKLAKEVDQSAGREDLPMDQYAMLERRMEEILERYRTRSERSEPSITKEKEEILKKNPHRDGSNFWHVLANVKSKEFKKNSEAMYQWNDGNTVTPKLVEKNKKGLNPIHIAVMTGNLRFIDALCDPTKRNMHEVWDNPSILTTNNGKTPLHLAVEGLAQAPASEKKVFNQMIRRLTYACPEMRAMADENGKTPIDVLKATWDKTKNSYDEIQMQLDGLEEQIEVMSNLQDKVGRLNRFDRSLLEVRIYPSELMDLFREILALLREGNIEKNIKNKITKNIMKIGKQSKRGQVDEEFRGKTLKMIHNQLMSLMDKKTRLEGLKNNIFQDFDVIDSSYAGLVDPIDIFLQGRFQKERASHLERYSQKLVVKVLERTQRIIPE